MKRRLTQREREFIIIWQLGRDDVGARFRNERRLDVDRAEAG